MWTPALFVLLLASYLPTILCYNFLGPRASCNKNYAVCKPKDASIQDAPPIGTELSTFYVDIVNTVGSNKKDRRELQLSGDFLHTRASESNLCCAEGTQCLLLQTLELPFCYDNYTTNYFLPGGSYGQIVSGNYTSPDGSTANLVTGNFTILGGPSGNIYGSASSLAKPDTATLAIPTQYTASGSGSAIPVTALGQENTYTTTIPGTTVSPSVVSVPRTSMIVSAGSTVSSMLTTEPASTIPGTTMAPQTSTITTKVTEALPTQKSDASRLPPKCLFSFGTLLAVLGVRAFA